MIPPRLANAKSTDHCCFVEGHAAVFFNLTGCACKQPPLWFRCWRDPSALIGTPARERGSAIEGRDSTNSRVPLGDDARVYTFGGIWQSRWEVRRYDNGGLDFWGLGRFERGELIRFARLSAIFLMVIRLVVSARNAATAQLYLTLELPAIKVGVKFLSETTSRKKKMELYDSGVRKHLFTH